MMGQISLEMSRRQPVGDVTQVPGEASRLLVDNATGAVAIVQDGVMKQVNTSLMKLIDYSEHELTSKPFLDFIHPDDQQMVAERYFKRLEGEESPSAYSFRIMDKHGNVRWVQLNALMLHWDGKPAILAFLADITEGKRAEEALLYQERRFQALTENCSDAIIVVSSDGIVCYESPSYERISGFKPEERIGTGIFERVHPEDIKVVADTFAQLLQNTAACLRAEVRIQHRDGSWRTVEVMGTNLLHNPSVEGIVVNLRDITERDQAENALKDSEERYRLLAENISDVIWVTDMNLKPTYISPSMENLLGYTAEESMKRRPMDALTPASLEVASEAFAAAMRAGSEEQDSVRSSKPLDLELIRKDGSSIWASTKVSFLRDQHGHPVTIMGVLRDVTERRDAKKRLEQTLEKLQRTMEGTIQAITATVEWRDPFTAGHQRRVAQLACAIADELGLGREQVQVIHMAGLLHDIGKISVPHEILSKPGRLSDAEMAMIRAHSQVGYDILKTVEFAWPVADMVVQHHERIDGSGYPSGLREEEILMEARILAVADVVEAMTAHRPYRKAPGLDKALEEISQNSGRLYDADVVYACLRLFTQQGFKFEEDSGLSPAWVA